VWVEHAEVLTVDKDGLRLELAFYKGLGLVPHACKLTTPFLRGHYIDRIAYYKLTFQVSEDVHMHSNLIIDDYILKDPDSRSLTTLSPPPLHPKRPREYYLFSSPSYCHS
jgi:hypothetical protein